MSFGRLGIAAPAATALVTVYTVPATTMGADIDVSIVNPSGAEITFDLAFSTAATPLATEYIEKGTKLTANGGRYILTGQRLSPGELVVIYAYTVGLVVRVSGQEITAL